MIKKPLEGKKTKRGLWDDGASRPDEGERSLFLLALPDPGGNGRTGGKVCEEPSLLKPLKHTDLRQIKLKMSVFLQNDS